MGSREKGTPAQLDRDVATVLNAFRSLVKELRAADREAVRMHGLGSAQIFVLHCLARHQPLSVNELAEKTASDQSTISLIITKLVARDLVHSKRAKDDARRAELTLAPRGRDLVRRLPLLFQERFISALESLSSSRRAVLAGVLSEVLEAMGLGDDHPPLLLTDHAPPRPRKIATNRARVTKS
jgi:DNA-binding MarR family transcriptional regulator